MNISLSHFASLTRMMGEEVQKTPRGWCEKLVDVAEDARYLSLCIQIVEQFCMAQIAYVRSSSIRLQEDDT